MVEGLTHQVRQLALILDEIREELVWSVRNDKFSARHSDRYVKSMTVPPDVEENDEEPAQPADEPSVAPPSSHQGELF